MTPFRRTSTHQIWQPKRAGNDQPVGRGGWTIIELLVTCLCIGLLLMLVLPGLLKSRIASREQTCFFRQRDLAQGILRYADGHAGALPPLSTPNAGWPVHLLPYISADASLQQFAEKRIAGGTAATVQLPDVSLPQFVCPAQSTDSLPATPLSFLVNAGYGQFTVEEDGDDVRIVEVDVHRPNTDWDRDGRVSAAERIRTFSTGVIWRPETAAERSLYDEDFVMTVDYIQQGDGLKYTLLLSEGTPFRSWQSTETAALGFVIDHDRIRFANVPAAQTQVPLIEAVDIGPFAINSVQRQQGRPLPVPSSWHGETVNVMFCDGSGRALPADIDPQAYARLLSSNGFRGE